MTGMPYAERMLYKETIPYREDDAQYHLIIELASWGGEGDEIHIYPELWNRTTRRWEREEAFEGESRIEFPLMVLPQLMTALTVAALVAEKAKGK